MAATQASDRIGYEMRRPTLNTISPSPMNMAACLSDATETR